MDVKRCGGIVVPPPLRGPRKPMHRERGQRAPVVYYSVDMWAARSETGQKPAKANRVLMLKDAARSKPKKQRR